MPSRGHAKPDGNEVGLLQGHVAVDDVQMPERSYKGCDQQERQSDVLRSTRNGDARNDHAAIIVWFAGSVSDFSGVR